MHHTKVKADIGLTKVISDLTLKGCIPCIPLSEHQAYDIVAMRNGKAFKLQVKYARLKKNGTVEVRFRRSWADKNGSHARPYSEEEFDYYAIYYPEKDKVLYIPNKANSPKAIRFDEPSNNQARYIKWADDYLVMK